MVARLFRYGLSYHAGLVLCDHHATAPRDLLFFLSRDNLNLVCSEAEKFEAVRSCGTNTPAVLSYAAGEDEKIHTTEESNVCTDYFAYRNGKDIQSKSGVSVVGAGTFFQRPHITLGGGEGEEAALMIQQILELIGAEPLVAQKVEEDSRIEIAGARAHRDAAGGSEANCRVDGHSVA